MLSHKTITNLVIGALMFKGAFESYAVASSGTNQLESAIVCGVESNGFQFCISLDKSTYRLAEDVFITLILKNVSSEPVSFGNDPG